MVTKQEGGRGSQEAAYTKLVALWGPCDPTSCTTSPFYVRPGSNVCLCLEKSTVCIWLGLCDCVFRVVVNTVPRGRYSSACPSHRVQLHLSLYYTVNPFLTLNILDLLGKSTVLTLHGRSHLNYAGHD